MRTTLLLLALALPAPAQAPAPLRVCATTTDLADLVRAIGGAHVSVTCFCQGPEDPHFLEAKPSFLKQLSEADLLVQTGLDLELAWLPALLANARNPAARPGGRGHLDASRVVAPLQVPAAGTDRSQGDVHALGNPHYLLDPLCGLAVAGAIRDALAALRGEHAAEFTRGYEAFRARLGAAMVGAELAGRYEFEKLAALFEHGRLAEFLERQGEQGRLGGWLGTMLPHAGAAVAADHGLWPYFARRFGIRVVALLEPKPGIAPTSKHLREVIATMRASGARAVLAAPYFDARHARFVAEATGAHVAAMAHQTGARPGAGDYLATVDANVRALSAALRKNP
jgi:ABC-type Zn uptake system ZnuABC Zn-binding protein ZnuA